MSDVFAAFPRRPLRLRQPVGAWGGIMLNLLGLVLFGGFVTWLAIDVGPDLVSDFAVQGTARPLRDARMVEGRCGTHMAIIHDCTLQLTQRGKDHELTRKVHYLFADFHVGSYTIQQVMGDPNRPETLTTDLGLDRLWNRAISLAVAAVLGLVLLLGVFATTRQWARQRKLVRSLSGKVLTPVVLRLLERTRHGWAVADPNGRRWVWQVPAKARPFLLNPANGAMLGVTAPGSAVAFPLDDRLRWVKLETAEQVALQAYRAKV